jgi:hypothetical protein
MALYPKNTKTLPQRDRVLTWSFSLGKPWEKAEKPPKTLKVG